MSNHKELIKDMLNSFINDNAAESSVTFHKVFSEKTREQVGGRSIDPKEVMDVDNIVEID